MLSTRGLIALINSIIAVLLSSTLLYQPQLFLLIFFLHAFLASYVILYIGRLLRIDKGMLEARREVSHRMVPRGGVITVWIKVSSKLEESFRVDIRDGVPNGLILVDGSTLKRGVLGRGGEEEIMYRAKVSPEAHRILYRYVTCVLYDPLGLVARRIDIPAQHELIILKEEMGPLQEAIQLKEHYTSPAPGIGINPFVGLDDEYLGVRPYEYGDRLRDIHWKKTATTQSDDSILVKRYERRSETQLNIVVDCSSSINAGDWELYLMDVSRSIGAIASAALDEGNIIQLYVLNPELSIEEVLNSRVSSGGELLERLSLIYPAKGEVQRELVDEIEARMSRGSRVIVITNPPSENQAIIGEVIERASRRRCITTLIIPDIASYYRSEEPEMLISVDAFLKDLWLRRLASNVHLILLSARASPLMLEWDLRRRR